MYGRAVDERIKVIDHIVSKSADEEFLYTIPVQVRLHIAEAAVIVAQITEAKGCGIFPIYDFAVIGNQRIISAAYRSYRLLRRR